MNHDRTIYPHPHMPGVWLDAEGRTYVDAQAAEVERLRAEVEALRTGVPLTVENAPRARVVETADGNVLRVAETADGRMLRVAGWESRIMDTLIHDGATVLAWRK